MKAITLILVIVFMSAFTACGMPQLYAEDAEGNIIAIEARKNDEPLTQAEKDLNFERQRINRMQDAIKDYFEDVEEAVITVEEPSEIEQGIAVVITMKPGGQLTDEEKEGIVSFVNSSYSSDLPLNVSLSAK